MKIDIFTYFSNIEELKSDFVKICSEENFPTKINYDIKVAKELERPDDIAVTYVRTQELEKGLDGKIEFGDKYFEKQYETRKFTILHEIIHAYQRNGDLKNWDKKWIPLLQSYEKKITDNNEFLWQVVKWIEFFYSQIFEIWDEIYFSKNYTHLHEPRMNYLLEIVRDSYTIDRFHKYGEYEIYPLLFEAVRLKYLSDVAKNTSSESAFTKMFQNHRDKLLTLSAKSQLNIDELLTTFTDTSRYPDPSKLEEEYEKFGTKLWNCCIAKTSD